MLDPPDATPEIEREREIEKKVLEYIDTLVGDILSPQQLVEELALSYRFQYSHRCASEWLEMSGYAVRGLCCRKTADSHDIFWRNILREVETRSRIQI